MTDSMSPSAVNGEQQRPSEIGVKPLASLKKHWLLALLLTILISSLGVPATLKLGKTSYSSQAVVYVSPRFVRNLQDDQEHELQSNQQYREFVQQQVRTINRYDIVEEALNKLGERAATWRLTGETPRRAVERLQGALNISPVPDTYQISVSLEGEQRDMLADIVNSVVNTYLEKAKQEEFYASDDRAGSLRAEREKVAREIEDKIARRTLFAQQLGVTTFNESSQNPYDQLLVSGKEALANSSRERIAAEAQLAAIDPKTPEGKRTLGALAQDLVAKDPGLNSLKASVNQKRSELFAKISGLSAEHPGRKAAEQELNELEAEVKESTERLTASFEAMIYEQRRSETERARKVEQDLATQVKAESAKAQDFSMGYQQALSLGSDIDRARKRLDEIDDRLDFLGLEKNAPGFVRLFSAAQRPEAPFTGGKKKYLVIFVLAGLILGLVAPVVVDLLDPRLKSARDLEKLLGFPPVAWILERRDEATKTLAEDQLLRLAAGLDRDRRSQATQIVVLTSVKSGAGTSTLTLDLARELSGMGVRALAVETNALKPDARYLTRPDDSTEGGGTEHELDVVRIEPARLGLASMLTGEATVDDRLSGDALLPDRVGVGALRDRRHLPEIHALGPLLRDFASVYQFVLVDAPPLLLSSDTEVLSSHADCVLLVVEAEATSKAELREAARVLERLSPRGVGAILNRVRVQPGDRQLAAKLKEYATGERPPTQTRLARLLWN